MHAAPTVEYPVGPQRTLDRLWRTMWSVSLLFLLSATVLYMPMGDVRRMTLGVVVAGLCLALALRLRRAETPVRGALRWDGLAWWWVGERGDLIRGRVRCVLDLQSLLLLRFESVEDGRGKWMWLAGGHPVLWPALRRALVAHGSVPGPAQAEAS